MALLQNTAVSERLLHQAYFDWLVVNGIQDETTLQQFLETYLGYEIPQKAFCPHHQSPFDFLADQFFERTKTTFGFANRSGGKTRTVAVLNVLDMVFKAGVEIASAGAIQEQANRGYEYLCDLFAREPLNQLMWSSTKAETILTNGSTARILVATWHGFNSPHPQKVRIDEIELIHPNILQEGFQMSQAKGAYAAQDTLTSTRKFPSGTVQKLIDEADQRKVKIISWCIFETVERCTRKCKGDPTYGDCPAHSRTDKDGNTIYLCGMPDTGGEADGKAHYVPGGWYRLDDMVKKMALLDADTVKAQWFNERPGAGVVVYGACFKPEPPFVVPTLEAEALLTRARKEKWERVYGIDFGANFACTMWMQDPQDLIWYGYAEYFFSAEGERPLAEHAKQLKLKDPLGYNARGIYIFADPAGRTAIKDLQGFGIFAVPANNDLYPGIQHMKRLLEERTAARLPRLRVFSSMPRLIKEMTELYLYRLKKDGEPDRDAVVPKNNHAADSGRYALYSWETIGTGRYRMRRLRGMW